MRGELGSPGTILGRNAELRLLGRALRSNCSERFAVTGELGIGRTALLRSLRDSAQASRHIRIAVECADTPHPASEARAHDRIRTALVRALLGEAPEPGQGDAPRVPVQRLAPEDPGQDDSAVWRLVCAEVARRTRTQALLVTLDDAHAADAASLRLLGRVLEACSAFPSLFVASLRDGEPVTAPRELNELLLGARRLPLKGLDAVEAGRLIRRLAGRVPRTSFAAECHRLSVGNPFLLTELVAHLGGSRADTPGARPAHTAEPPEVGERVIGRLNVIDPRATRLITAAAIVGGRPSCGPALAAHLSELTLQDTLTAADLLVRMRLMKDEDTLPLSHPLLRNALLGRTTLMARNATHLAAAAYLHDRQAPAAHVAGHLVASSTPAHVPWSTPVLIVAGRTALAAGDPRAARRYLERAEQVAVGDQRQQVMLCLIDAKIRTAPASGLQDALAALRQAATDESRARLLSRIGPVLAFHSGAEEEERALSAATTALAGTGLAAWPRQFRTFSRLYESGTRGDDHPAGRDRAPLPRGHDEASGDAPDALRGTSGAARAFCRLLDGVAPAESVAEAEVLLANGQRPEEHPLAPAMALMILGWNGRLTAAAELLERVRDAEDGQERHPPRHALLQSVAGYLALARGELEPACTLLRESLDALAEHGTRHGHPVRVWLAGMLAEALLSRGMDKDVRALLRDERCLGDLPPGWHSQDVLVARARLYAEAGDPESAVRDLAEAGRRAVAHPWYPWSAHGTDLLRRTGRSEQARELARVHLRWAEAAGAPRQRGAALHALGAVAGGGAGETALREAAGSLGLASARLDQAHVLADLGALLVGDRREEAVPVLAEALRLAGRCGAEPLAERIRERLTSEGGGSSRQTALGGVLSLTARERQVLVDAVRGQTNGSISKALHITQRTVELHLSSAYRKLGITGRKDFPRLFGTAWLWNLLVDTRSVVGRLAQPAPSEAPVAHLSVGSDEILGTGP